jgi:hypothetical protein
VNSLPVLTGPTTPQNNYQSKKKKHFWASTVSAINYKTFYGGEEEANCH